MGQRYSITLGCWQFLQPDISNIIHLAGLYCGEEDAEANLEVDKQRRARKRQAIQRLEGQWQDTVKKLSYLLKDADSIDMLQPTVTKALASIEDEIEFLANPKPLGALTT